MQLLNSMWYYPVTCLEGLRTTMNSPVTTVCLGRDSKQAPPEHRKEVLPIQSTRSAQNPCIFSIYDDLTIRYDVF
jgi:hypothetical protein